MLVTSVVLAPSMLAAAAIVERRLGASAAGWVAALPVAFGVSVFAVATSAGPAQAAVLTLSAASHVGAQVMFALAFANVLLRRGLLLGAAAGTATYALCSLVLIEVPPPAAVGMAGLLLLLGPRLVPRTELRASSRRRWWSTTLACLVAAGIVAATVTTSHAVGPLVGGAVAAFPTMSLTAAAIATRDGRDAGVQALNGLVRSLPCYLAFCLTVSATMPSLGLWAIPCGLAACVTLAALTWRGIPVTRGRLLNAGAAG